MAAKKPGDFKNTNKIEGKTHKMMSKKMAKRQSRLLKKSKTIPKFYKPVTGLENTDEEPEKQIKGNVKIKKQRKRIEGSDLEKEKSETRKKQLLKENEMEDKNINKLLKQMKLHRRKSTKLPMSFVRDGLDYVLNACEGIHMDDEEPDLHLDDVLEEPEKDANPPKKRVRFSEPEKEDKTSEKDPEPEEPARKTKKRKKIRNKSKDEDDELREDIYGRLRDPKGNVVSAVTAYMPPAKRAILAGESEAKKTKLLRLRRQLQGHLNRLSESNLQPISTEVEKLYSTNSRNDMNATMVNILVDSLVQSAPVPERLIQEHALLIALLHANVGTEIGAHFLQSVCVKFTDLHAKMSEEDGACCNNLLLFLSHLYNFKITSSLLVYDILNRLADKFTEKDIELVLLILRSVGFTLRKDDPMALKEMILKLQSKAPTATGNQSRVNFLMETVMAIRNNNMHKIPNYDTTHTQHLKKLLRCFLHQGCSVTELKISLSELLSAPTHGRWWVIGSAWNEPDQKPEDEEHDLKVDAEGEDVLELARSQRMNTDVRKKVFCILMKAEDYADAFEKLVQLGLRNHQEREIVIVSVECCMREKTFNPYYAHLVQRFCTYNKRFRLTMQFALWDKLKRVKTLPDTQISHLARLLSHLCLTKALPITVLKVIQFSEMNKQLVKFLREVLLAILLHDPEENCLEVFAAIPAIKRRMFVEGLRLFLHHFLLRNRAKILSEDLHPKLESRVNLVTGILDAEHRVVF